MIRSLFLFFCVLFLSAHSTIKIVRVVEGVPISTQDVEECMALARSPILGRPFEVKDLYQKTLDVLIEQILVFHEAERFGIVVYDKEISDYLLKTMRIESLDVIKTKLLKNNLNYDKFILQIKAHLAWRKIVNAIFVNNIVINDSEIVEWKEQNHNKYGKKYYFYKLVAEKEMPKHEAYNRKIDCSNIPQFANEFGLRHSPEISLYFSDMVPEIKSQIINGLKLYELSNVFNGNEFFVICSAENGKQLDDDDIYQLLYAKKINADKQIFLDKLKNRYYAEN